MKKRIELNILTFILMEAIILLFFFKESIFNILLGTIMGIIIGKITSKIKHTTFIKTIFFIISILLSIAVFYKIVFFISHNLLRNYSIIIISLSFFSISLFLTKKGYHSFIKSVEISNYFYLLLKIISIILIIPLINANNLNIHLFSKININYHFILIAFIIFYLQQSIFYLTKYQISSRIIIISIINPIIIKLLTILVMGNHLVMLYPYPFIHYLKHIRYFDFIERLDGILSFQYLISFFFLFSFIMLLIKKLSN